MLKPVKKLEGWDVFGTFPLNYNGDTMTVSSNNMGFSIADNFYGKDVYVPFTKEQLANFRDFITALYEVKHGQNS